MIKRIQNMLYDDYGSVEYMKRYKKILNDDITYKLKPDIKYFTIEIHNVNVEETQNIINEIMLEKNINYYMDIETLKIYPNGNNIILFSIHIKNE